MLKLFMYYGSLFYFFVLHLKLFFWNIINCWNVVTTGWQEQFATCLMEGNSSTKAKQKGLEGSGLLEQQFSWLQRLGHECNYLLGFSMDNW